MNTSNLKKAVQIQEKISKLKYEISCAKWEVENCKNNIILLPELPYPNKPSDVLPFEEPKKPTDDIYQKSKMTDKDIKVDAEYDFSGLFSGIKGLFGMITGMFTSNQIILAIFITLCLFSFYIIAFGIALFVDLISLPFKLIIAIVKGNKEKNININEIKQEIKDCIDEVLKYENSYKKYLSDVENFKTVVYPNMLKNYKDKCISIDEENKKIRQKNEKTLNAANDLIANKQNKFEELEKRNLTELQKLEQELDDILQSEKFPKSYLGVIDQIIKLLDDYRADTVKEALNIYEEEKQRRMAFEEQNRKMQYQVKYRYYSYFHERYEIGYEYVMARSESDALAQVEGSVSAIEW